LPRVRQCDVLADDDDGDDYDYDYDYDYVVHLTAL
jgi:hypothetical protein